MGSVIDLDSPLPTRRPRIAVTLGDPSGVGPELIAKLLSNPENPKRADIFLLADQCELESAVQDAGNVKVLVSTAPAGPNAAQLLDDNSSGDYKTERAKESRDSGARCMHQLRRALKLVEQGKIDAIVFGPLNKSSLKMAGMKEEDELRWFAKQLNYAGTTSEINIAGPLWTGRVTSHIGIEDVAARITTESTVEAIQLLNRLRWESGLAAPRLGVCALNPHNGENGAFGRQEIEAIRPAVKIAREELGIDAQGPFPCDTIFLKREHFDGIVTMYHDQGQIAMKLLGFDGGVTIQGGLPIPVATPAHGTAFDIAGKNLAAITSTQNAFSIATTMAERIILRDSLKDGTGAGEAAPFSPVKAKSLLTSTVVDIPSCC
ncbi:4-hydroxythreonine-4-phosphate dehydrogenase [Microdochium trichocladiopsis]|uniref:4-hydroxythreonine-4-phosphate dehydrogenase n=1 Tax=Microdochium trichocladiopsis TaxID=1682393 RepID=A0A9P8YDV9_9PEZI|nr:4-hydroxythreonine-4-phosphate dehydrogenase [Microdochium trichocladiopsis]KAH7037067.1 4-hydroxythreonine-4-phosphate dehydrogenase [Microdochium trichocladiopsis]